MNLAFNTQWITNIGLYHYLTISVLIFSLGIAVILSKKNAIAILMGIELLLNAACLNFVAFAHFAHGGHAGQTAALFVIVIAAAEAAVALAIIVSVYRRFDIICVDQIDTMRE